MPAGSSDETFVSVEWSEVETDGREWTAGAAVVPLAVVVVAFGLDAATPGAVLAGPDWVLVGAAAVFLPVAWLLGRGVSLRQFASDPVTGLATAWVVGFVLIGGLGPVVVSMPEPNFLLTGQPPVWGSVDAGTVQRCAGPVADGRCRGSWRFPLGTTEFNGQRMGPLLVLATRTALTVAAGAAMLVVPVGTGIGTAAAVAGGRVERALMWIAEFLQTLPAILLYVLLFYWTVDGRLVLLTGLLGLVGWGGIARSVRTEMVELSNESYAKAARIGGASRRRVVVRHLLPNVLPGVVTAAALQVPLFVIVEASVSFLSVGGVGGNVTLGDPSVVSFGQLAFRGIITSGPPTALWVGWLPVGVLVVTAFAFTVVGDALVDTLDPRAE